jgi:UDP-N-acetylmuramate dehydrogenase
VTDLSTCTTLRVGGSAERFVRVGRRDELVAALVGASTVRGGLFVLGGGSNIVVSDAGLPGTVVHVAGGRIGRRVGADAVELTVDAGVAWDALVETSVELGAGGIELLSGIPGTVGAAPVQNIAAYGQQVCDVIASVGTFDTAPATLAERSPTECGFGYRTSRFKADWHDRMVITHVRLRLPLAAAQPPEPSTYGDLVRHFDAHGGDATDLADRRSAVLAVRTAKSMVLDDADPMSRSAGSFFMNPEVPATLADDLTERFAARGLDVQYLEGQRASHPDAATRRVPAALVLRASGFRPGDRWGPVQLSDKHVLAIVTHDGATADDVWQLSHLVRARVANETGVQLHPEPRFVGAFAEPDVAAFQSCHDFSPGMSTDPSWLQA